MGSISPVGGPPSFPEQPQHESLTNQNHLQAIDSFTQMIQNLASLIAKAKEGGHHRG